MSDIEELKRIRERDEEDDLMQLQSNLRNLAQHEKKCFSKMPNDKEIHHAVSTNLIAMIIAQFLAIAFLCSICANTMSELAKIADDLVEANKLNVELQNQLEYYNFIVEPTNEPEK